MNQQTDNMYIDDGYSDEALRKREEIREHISWFREFLTFGTSLPEHIRRRYGLEGRVPAVQETGNTGSPDAC